jgi:hypothetical protein
VELMRRTFASIAALLFCCASAIAQIGPPGGSGGGSPTGAAGGSLGGTYPNPTVVTNANLTGPITSVGNATSIASQTGTGTKFVVDTAPTLASPTFTGTVNGAAVIWSGNNTAAAFIPSVATVPTNGIYLPAANTVGIATNSIIGFQLNGTQQLSIGPGPLTPGSTNTTLTINRNTAAVPSADANAVTGIAQIVGADGESTSLSLYSFINGALDSVMMLAKARGTLGSPLAIQAGDGLGDYTWRAYTGSAWSNQRGTIRAVAFNNWSTSDNSVSIQVSTVPSGQTSGVTMARFQNSGGFSIGSSLNTTDPGNQNILSAAHMFGGVTSSFPALFNSGTTLQARLADNSADAPLTASLFNGLAITNNGTNTLAIAAGKTLTFDNSLELAGTDATKMTFPTTSATIARTDAAQGFTGIQTISNGATLPGSGAGTILQVAGGNIGGTGLELDSFNGTGQIFQRRANTSSVAPSAITSGNNMGAHSFQGWNAASYVLGAQIRSIATATTWDASHNGAYIEILTSPDSGGAAASQLRVQGSGGLSVGSANVATDPGAGVVLASVQQTTVTTVSGLPTCNGAAEGSRKGATDLLAPTFLTAATGGGAVHGSVYCNGTAWVTD